MGDRPPPSDQVVSLWTQATSDNDPRDALDQQIRAGWAPLSQDAPPPHVDDDLLIAHLQKGLSGEERASLLRHLARCALCCDRLEASADALRVTDFQTKLVSSATSWPHQRKSTPAADTSTARPLFDVGRALMQMRVQLGQGGVLRIVATDAEIRVEPATLLRRSARSPSLAFQKRVDAAKLQVALLATGEGQLQVSLSVDPAPQGWQASLLVGGQVVASEPLRLGQAVFRALPTRSVTVCLRCGTQSMGHIKLDLEAADDL